MKCTNYDMEKMNEELVCFCLFVGLFFLYVSILLY